MPGGGVGERRGSEDVDRDEQGADPGDAVDFALGEEGEEDDGEWEGEEDGEEDPEGVHEVEVPAAEAGGRMAMVEKSRSPYGLVGALGVWRP